MGVLPIVLVILAMKIPIFGLMWFVWWAARRPEGAEGPAEPIRTNVRPRPPEPARPRGPRRRGPHGAAAPRPSPAARRGHREGPLPGSARASARAPGPAADPLSPTP